MPEWLHPRAAALLLLACLGTLSCDGPEVVYQEAVTFPDGGWSYGDSAVFDFTVADTSARYDLVLAVEHTTSFPYQNFYVEVSTLLPGDRRLRQQLSLQLADNFGQWFGECDGKNCTNRLALQEATRFDATGAHRIVVRQHSRDNPLTEVNGLAVELIRLSDDRD